jgi:hypothetical protein
MGYTYIDAGSINNIHSSNGMVRSAATSPGDIPAIFRVDETSKRSHNFFACSSVLKASIRRVKFAFNHTQTLKQLSALSHESIPTNEEPPLWAVENTGRQIGDVDALWGIISARHANNPAISTLRSPHLYLPAILTRPINASSKDSLAGASAPQAILDNVYNFVLADRSNLQFGAYTGDYNFVMYSRWLKFSQSAETVPKIIDLIWTDMMANMVVGTRSPVTVAAESGDNPLLSRPVTIRERKIRYDIKYGIPAIILLIFWVSSILIMIVFVVLKKAKIEDLRQLINQTATGRVVTMAQFPELCERNVKTKEWAKTAGKEVIVIRYKTGKSGVGESEEASEAGEVEEGEVERIEG